MKKFKTGFTFAEVLIALCIIGVVSAFGYTSVKDNVEKAYDRYYYTSYDAITTAIRNTQSSTAYRPRAADPNNQNTTANPQEEYSLYDDDNGGVAGAFWTTVGSALNANCNGAGTSCTTPNHVSYSISNIGSESHSYRDADNILRTKTNFRYRITVEVPTVKSKQGQNKYDIYYLPFNSRFGGTTVFIPGSPNVATNGYRRARNLQEDRTLLGYFSDDGRVGRRNSNGNSYTRIGTIRSARDIFCSTYGNTYDNIINCNGIARDANLQNTMPRLVNPRRYL